MTQMIEAARAESFLEHLRNQSIGLQEGFYTQADAFQLCMDGQLMNCNGNNRSGSYCAMAVPEAPGQPVDVPDFIKMEDPAHPERDLHLGFHLLPSDAIVLLGTTPPEMKYFSYAFFLATCRAEPPPSSLDDRTLEGRPIRNVPGPQLTPPGRKTLFGALGEPLNNLKIHTEGKEPFDKTFVLVIASDTEVYERVREAAVKAGYPESCINLLVVPSEMVKLGVEHDSDTFTFINRVAEPVSDSALDSYLSHPPVRVFRATLDVKARRPLPVPFLTPRGDGHTEFALWHPVQRLRQAILDHYREHYDAIELTTDVWLQESNLSNQQGLDNLGESRDTVYLGTESFLLPEDALVVAYGVNHARMGKATYSNVVVYGDQMQNGVVSVDDGTFEDSASRFLDGPDAKNLYAWGFGFLPRPGDKNYSAIPCTPPPCRSAWRLVPGQRVFLGFRAYMEPSTKVGPAWHELILDRVIVFLPRKR